MPGLTPLERLDSARIPGFIYTIDLCVRGEDDDFVAAGAGGVVHGEPVSARGPLHALDVNGREGDRVEEGGSGGVMDREEVGSCGTREQREVRCRGPKGERAMGRFEGLRRRDGRCGGKGQVADCQVQSKGMDEEEGG